MRRSIGIALVALFAFSSLGLAKVYVDYDRNAKFGSYKTFAWMEPNGYDLEDSHPLVHKRIVNYIEAKMKQGGLKEVTSNPDLLVTYYVSTKEETQINTVSMGYGYGPGWGWDPYWSGYWGSYGSMGSTTYVSTYTKGTMIIDIVDAKTKKLIWRGTMEHTVPDNPEKAQKKIFKGIDKIVKKYQKMRRKQLKEEAKAAKASS
ncbi:MAG: DUF4136 domain-containing protein [Acidobacteria bacterium]|nr:DUF4136 domain-containing protein [Acidobacteriota bacterium]